MYSSSVLELIEYVLALPVFMKSILTCEIPSPESWKDSHIYWGVNVLFGAEMTSVCFKNGNWFIYSDLISHKHILNSYIRSSLVVLFLDIKSLLKYVKVKNKSRRGESSIDCFFKKWSIYRKFCYSNSNHFIENQFLRDYISFPLLCNK